MSVFLLLAILAGFLPYVTSQCPGPEWKIRGGSCYLFKMTNYEDDRNWNEAQSSCHSYNASLVTIHNADEQQYVYSTMLQETVPSIVTNGWIGMYKEGIGSPYIWESGDEVVYTNWAPGEPNDGDGSQNCVRIYGNSGGWDDYFCQNSVDDNFIRHGYVCKKDLDDTSVLPQYEIALSGDFISFSGEDFSNLCTLAYAESMNARAKDMMTTVNGLIGSQLCDGMTSQHMRLDRVTAPLLASGSTGTTSMFYIAVVGTEPTFTQVETCALNISSYLSIHTNWDSNGEVLPPEEGCPGVHFIEDVFTRTGNQWLCQNSLSKADNSPSSTNRLLYRMTQNGVFQSADGSNISASCLQEYNTKFLLDTALVGQEVEQMMGDELCQGKQISFSTISAALILASTQTGGSLQNYELQPSPDNSFDDVHSCSFEVSGYLSDHNNWESLLPPVDGCPQLSFTTSFFSLGETEWMCD